MYNIGDYVIYKRDGICRVDNVAALSIASAEKGHVYYYLRPEKYEGMIYVPVDECTGLRPLISQTEARTLLDSIQDMPVPITHARDKKSIHEHYDALMKPNTCDALARTVKSIYVKHATSSGALGKLSSLEEQLLKRSEQALCEELSIVLDIPEENIRHDIEKSLASCTAVQ